MLYLLGCDAATLPNLNLRSACNLICRLVVGLRLNELGHKVVEQLSSLLLLILELVDLVDLMKYAVKEDCLTL